MSSCFIHKTSENIILLVYKFNVVINCPRDMNETNFTAISSVSEILLRASGRPEKQPHFWQTLIKDVSDVC